MKQKKCVMCGFNKKVLKHHIIKFNNFGSDEKDNLVYLCPNHHWIADFGEEEDREKILNEIINITGKKGSKIPEDKINFIELKIRHLLSETFPYILNDEEFWQDMKQTSNYNQYKKWLLGRGIDSSFCRKLNQKSEMLILINKLRKNLPNLNA